MENFLFNGLSNLEKIEFSNNQIQVIDSDTFRGLSMLEKIDFSNNQIEEDEIYPSTFNDLPSLLIKWFEY